MAVWGADVGTNAYEELHYGIVPTTDSIMKGGDALIVRLAWITHLTKKRTFLTYK